MRMHNPPHPGEIIKRLMLGTTRGQCYRGRQAVGVSRKTLSSVLNAKADISSEMVVRLFMAFGTSAESWLNHQTQYDVAR
jgi:addiction module HigA family antidote